MRGEGRTTFVLTNGMKLEHHSNNLADVCLLLCFVIRIRGDVQTITIWCICAGHVDWNVSNDVCSDFKI